MYECIIFDVDGTLIDTNEATIMALDRVIKEETGQQYNNKELSVAIGIPGKVSLGKFGIEDVIGANIKWNQYLMEYYNHIKVYSGIQDLITELSNMGVLIGIVTSNTRYELNNLLKHFMPFRLMEYVNHAVSADDTERHKPYPDPITRFLQISKTDSSRAIYIGDTVYDMKCAFNAKVDFGLAMWERSASMMRDIKAKFIFNKPKEILELYDKRDAYPFTL